jgi:hypothetical protein
MANISSNPWSLTSTDPATATITGATGLTLNADGTVTITTTGALTFNTTAEGGANPQGFTVIGAANPLYNGFYNRLSGASGASSFVMAPQFSIPAGTAQSGGGTLAQCLYRGQIRVEDMSWQNINTAGVASGTLELHDRAGNLVWQSTFGVTATFGQLNRGKVFWINGLTPITIPTNSIVLITVN